MTDKKTVYGTIHYGGPCKDDYGNIVVYDQPKLGGQVVRLQRPAMRSFKAAEERCGRPIPLTGSQRSCAFQAACHAEDPSRFADPDTSGHPRGLCIDVSTAISWLRKRKIKRALTHEGWFQARSDEPWHWSYGISV